MKKIRQAVNFFNETQVGILAFAFSVVLVSNFLVFASNHVSDSLYEDAEIGENISSLSMPPTIIKVLFSPSKSRKNINKEISASGNRSAYAPPAAIDAGYAGTENSISKKIDISRYDFHACSNMLDYYGDAKPSISAKVSFVLREGHTSRPEILSSSGYYNVDLCIVKTLYAMEFDASNGYSDGSYEATLSM